jgi:RNA polymerase sigma-70 factor (ECF subfamily)
MSMTTVTMPEIKGSPMAPELESLFRQHSQLVYRTACAVTGSPADAEDVLQTIFLRLMRRTVPPYFYKAPERYLYKAAVNASLNMIRSRQRQVLVGDINFFDASQDTPSNSNEAIIKQLRKAIATLSPRTTEILILRYVHDYTESEIARLLGRSRGTIAVTLFRSRNRLRKLLAPSAGENR